MTARKGLLGAAAAAVLVIGVGVGALWYFFLRDSEPAPVSLDAALTAAAVSSSSPSGTTGAAGGWSIESGSASFAGYRVNENLVAFGSRTAVGRTQGVQGSLVHDGRAVTSGRIAVDLTTLTSDQPLRDDTLKTSAIQSCQYPTATFELTSPFSATLTPGAPLTQTLAGSLTLHGVTRPVMIDVKAQMENGRLVVVGSTPIAFADYNIAQPQSFYVVSLDNRGIMEFQLIFSRTSTTATPAPQASPTAIPGCRGGGAPPPGGTPPGGRPPGSFPPPSGSSPAGFPGGGGINTPAPTPSPVGQ